MKYSYHRIYAFRLAIALAFISVIIDCIIFYKQTPLAATMSTPTTTESVEKDKIVFASRMNGKAIYAKAEIFLPLEVVWFGSKRNFSPSESIRSIDADAQGLEGVWELMTEVKNINKLMVSTSLPKEPSCRFTSKAGFASSDGNSFLPFERLSTYWREPLRSQKLLWVGTKQWQWPRPLYLECGTGVLDLWWTQRDPVPDGKKLYLSEDWLQSAEELPASREHPLGGIRIYSKGKGKGGSYGLGLALKLSTPDRNLLSSLAPGDQMWLRKRLDSIYANDVHSFALSSTDTIIEHTASYDGLRVLLKRPAWAEQRIDIPIWKDSRKRLAAKTLQQILEARTEIIEVKNIPLHLKTKQSLEHASPWLSGYDDAVILWADSVDDALKAFEGEELKAYWLDDGANKHLYTSQDSVTSTLLSRIMLKPANVHIRVLYRLLREPRIFIGWGWEEKLDIGESSVGPPYTIWP